jgi:hypothetical protein
MNTCQIGDDDQFMGGQAWEYYMQALVVKDCKELVNKIKVAFFLMRCCKLGNKVKTRSTKCKENIVKKMNL